MEIRTRTETEHKVTEPPHWDYHEWWLKGDKIALDRIGRRNPRMYFKDWLVVRCNNPDCPAISYVNESDMIHAALGPPPEGRMAT